MAPPFSHEFICSWLDSTIVETHVPPTPPPSDTPPRPLKRNRSNSMSAGTRSGRGSPKKRGLEQEDGVSPVQSASQVGRCGLLELTSQTRLSAVTTQSGISSPKRPASPTREASIKLRDGIPAILVDPIVGLPEKPPEPICHLRNTLSKDFDAGLIPAGLEVLICQLRSEMVHNG
jgi:hypothetical protein